MAEEPIQLKPLTESDVAAIRNWSTYPAWAKDLDYALRPGGWLDQFQESPTNHRFAAWSGDQLVGFALLTGVADGDAEFYIALHPDYLGQGIGRSVTEQTLKAGFESLDLSRIHLKVREWHERGQHLYENVGFRKCGHEVAEIQGKPISFVKMEILRDQFK